MEQVRRNRLEEPVTAVLVLHARVDGLRGAGPGDRIGEDLPDAVTVVRVKEPKRAPPEVLAFAPAENRLRRRARVDDAPVRVEDRDHVAAVLHEGAEALLALPQRVGGRLPLRDVSRRQYDRSDGGIV